MLNKGLKTIEVVDRLPKRGDASNVYTLSGDRFNKFYEQTSFGKWVSSRGLDEFARKEESVNIILSTLVIKRIDDLEPYLSGDEYVLPAGLVVLNNTVNLGNKAIRLSTNTTLRGLANSSFISSALNGAVRATNLDSNLVLRELNVISLAGPAFVLEGSIQHQLNMFFVGMIGVKAAIVNGFDVQSFKQCYIEASDGITFDGVVNKIFVSESPFYGVTDSAMTFSSTLNCQVADIVTSFFKFDSPGVGITAETGYSIIEGKVRGSLKVGTATPLVGLAASDENWMMTDNSGIANSRIIGGLYLVTSSTTTITAINTPVKVAGVTTTAALNERLVGSVNNRLTYTGLQPTVGMFTGTFAVASGNNSELAFYIAKNEIVLEETKSFVRVGTGGDERFGSVTGLIPLINGDYVEVWAENLQGTGNLTCLSLNLNGLG